MEKYLLILLVIIYISNAIFIIGMYFTNVWRNYTLLSTTVIAMFFPPMSFYLISMIIKRNNISAKILIDMLHTGIITDEMFENYLERENI